MKYLTVFSISLFLLGFHTLTAAPSDHPWDLSIYSFENLGKDGDAFKYGTTYGSVGSGENIFLSGYSVDAGNQLATWPQAAFAGGDFSSKNGSVYGDLEVGGNLYLYGVGYADTARVGGNLVGRNATFSGTAYLGGQNQSNLSITGDVFTNQAYMPTFDHSKAKDVFQAASSYWGSLNPTASWVNQWGKIQVGDLQSGRNIVDISLDDIASAWGIGLTGPADAFVIFNITDSTVTGDDLLKRVSFQLSGGLGMEDILFNITNAESLTLQSGNYASILAPGADLNLASTSVIGSLVGENIYGSGSARDTPFAGYMVDQDHFITSVPEPHTWLILGSLLLFSLTQTKKAFY